MKASGFTRRCFVRYVSNLSELSSLLSAALFYKEGEKKIILVNYEKMTLTGLSWFSNEKHLGVGENGRRHTFKDVINDACDMAQRRGLNYTLALIKSMKQQETK